MRVRLFFGDAPCALKFFHKHQPGLLIQLAKLIGNVFFMAPGICLGSLNQHCFRAIPDGLCPPAHRLGTASARALTLCP
ncbi:MAG: hypothetical protein OXU86_07020, partial [Thaumarchaeota archaeon]|nr:hypothetical protein [Nitrososphaerota archaeon]